MFDLDAARAARREALGDAPEFTFGGNDYKLPVEMSYPAAMALQAQDVDAGLVHLLGAENYDRFMEEQPSPEDVVALIEWIAEEYAQRGQTADGEDSDGDDQAEDTKGTGRGKASRSKS
jgi:hypothetical protein